MIKRENRGERHLVHPNQRYDNTSHDDKTFFINRSSRTATCCSMFPQWICLDRAVPGTVYMRTISSGGAFWMRTRSWCKRIASRKHLFTRFRMTALPEAPETATPNFDESDERPGTYHNFTDP